MRCGSYTAVLDDVAIGHAVFGDVERHALGVFAMHPRQQHVQTFGIDLPAHVGHRQRRGERRADAAIAAAHRAACGGACSS